MSGRDAPGGDAPATEPWLSHPSRSLQPMTEFTDEHRRVLDFERSRWKYAGAKEAAIRDEFDMGPTRYYQVLNWVIDQPEALEYDPLGVQRLRRLRTRRANQRSARRTGFDAG